MAHASDTSKHLKQLTDKRLALESLINITVSIQAQQESLLELSVIARPSQDFPAKLIVHIKQLSQRIGDLPVPELLQRLEAIEKVMAASLDKILLLANIDANKLRDAQLDNLSIDEFVDAISNFKRRTQTAVALRFLLKDRGVAIAPFTLNMPQESVFGHIEALKVKEKRCVKQIRKEIVEIVKDSDKMIKDENFTDTMKQEILKVRQAMQVNLEHLDNGGCVSEIPNVFETIVLESSVGEIIVIQEPEVAEITEATEAKTEDQKSPSKDESLVVPESFWQLFGRWISSPWKVSWKSLKNNPPRSKTSKKSK